MTTLSFADQVGDWARESEARLLAVFRMSVQKLASEMTRTRLEGGRLPILTGNLRRSFLASTTAMPPTASGDKKFESSQNYGLVIASAQLGGKVYLGFQAAYARRQNYGFVGTDRIGRTYNVAGVFFVEYVASLWPQIVSEVEAQLQGRVAAAQAGA